MRMETLLLYHFRPPFCLLGLGHLWMLPSLMHCHMVHHGTIAPQATLSMKSTTFPNSPFTNPSITSKFLMSITLAPTLNSRTSGSPRANCVSVLVCLYHFRPPFCLLGLGHLWMLPSLMHCHMVHHGTTGNIYALPYGTPWHHRQHLICTAIWYTMVPQATSMHCHMVHHGTTGNTINEVDHFS